MNPTQPTILALLATPLLAVAGPDGKSDAKLTKAPEEKSWCERVWEIPTIYKDTDNPFIQEIRFVGRFHGDVYQIDSDAGYDQDWIVRRLRGGVKIQFLKDFTAHVEVDFSPQQPTPFYTPVSYTHLTLPTSDLV